MFKGIGVDIEEIGRFKRLIRKKRFLRRVFSSEEIRYCGKKKNKAQHFAVRFAAKEAVWKAISDHLTRSRDGLTHKDISVRNTPRGKPTIVLPKQFASISRKILISLSHSRGQAVAVALFKG